MGTNNEHKFATITLPVSQAQTPDIGTTLKRYFFHWPIFLLSLIVFLAGSFFYLKNTKSVYPVSATVEFKNVKTTDYSTVEKTNLQTLDQISSPIVFENEIEVLKSKKLMLQVVKDLKLWINYSKKGGVFDTDLYGESPVIFQFIKTPAVIGPDGIKLDITLKEDGNSFLINDADGKQTEFKFGQYIQSGFGMWKLDKTPLLEGYLGANLAIGVRDPSSVADGYVAAIKTNLDSKDVPFVELMLSEENPKRGEDVLNSLLKTYLKFSISEKNKKTEETIKFMTKRIDSIGKDLHLNESQIENYSRNQGLTDIAAQSQAYVQDNQYNQKALSDINLQVRIINSIENYVNSPGSNKQPSTVGLQDASLNSMLDKLTELQLNKQHLLANNPPDNPVFEPINAEINTLQSSIREKVRNDKETLLLTKNQLEANSSRSEGLIRNVPTQKMEYGGMERNKDVEEKLYTFLLEQREQLSLKYASTVSDAQVVDYAHTGTAKWPKPLMIYFMAAFMGIFFPVGVIYTRNKLDNKITDRKQIEAEIDVPILAELSYQESSTQIVISKERGSFAIGEQFRALRTKLYQVLNGGSSGHHGINGNGINGSGLGKVALVTSSTSGEGKSFLSANMAVTLAFASRKTIVLEMDLRKPMTSAIFDMEHDHPGISDYLNEQPYRLEDLIQHSGIQGLDVLSCGPILENPSELLEKGRLDELIMTLRKMYDYIIIDTPPIHLVTDAIIIARVADASLYVIRQGYTLKEELGFINEVYSEGRLPNLNIVFNGIKKEKYGYGYDYNNSYYNTYTSRPKTTVGYAVKSFLSRF